MFEDGVLIAQRSAIELPAERQSVSLVGIAAHSVNRAELALYLNPEESATVCTNHWTGRAFPEVMLWP